MKGLRKRLVNMFFWIRSNYFAPKEFLIKSIARMRFYRSKSKNMWTMTDQTMWGVTDKNISQDFLRANELSLGKTTMIIANMKVWIIQKWLATFDYHEFNFLNISSRNNRLIYTLQNSSKNPCLYFTQRFSKCEQFTT